MKKWIKKAVIYVVTFHRRWRSFVATRYLKMAAKSCGHHVGAARIPRISRTAVVEIGNHAGFNGMTISGMGGGKNRQLLP